MRYAAYGSVVPEEILALRRIEEIHVVISVNEVLSQAGNHVKKHLNRAGIECRKKPIWNKIRVQYYVYRISVDPRRDLRFRLNEKLDTGNERGVFIDTPEQISQKTIRCEAY